MYRAQVWLNDKKVISGQMPTRNGASTLLRALLHMREINDNRIFSGGTIETWINGIGWIVSEKP